MKWNWTLKDFSVVAYSMWEFRMSSASDSECVILPSSESMSNLEIHAVFIWPAGLFHSHRCLQTRPLCSSFSSARTYCTAGRERGRGDGTGGINYFRGYSVIVFFKIKLQKSPHSHIEVCHCLWKPLLTVEICLGFTLLLAKGTVGQLQK